MFKKPQPSTDDLTQARALLATLRSNPDRCLGDQLALIGQILDLILLAQAAT